MLNKAPTSTRIPRTVGPHAAADTVTPLRWSRKHTNALCRRTAELFLYQGSW